MTLTLVDYTVRLPLLIGTALTSFYALYRLYKSAGHGVDVKSEGEG